MKHKMNRRGTLALFMCLLMLPLAALIAFSVDYGFLLFVKTDLQRAADQAVVAAVRELVPDANGYQDLDETRATLREYIEKNMGSNFSVRDSDIEIGRYNPAKVYTDFEILNTGTFDTVRVTIRRDDLANASVSLFFARLFNRANAEVVATATAVLQKSRYLGPGTSVLPLAVTQATWDGVPSSGEFSIYGDGKIEDEFGNTVSGNWGTVDIGPSNNSTADQRNQIENGLSQNDLDALHSQGAIPDPAHIDSQSPLILNADPGFSAGMKSGIASQHGTPKLIPIYEVNNAGGSGGGKKGGGSGGNNATFKIVGWAAVTLVSSKFNGSKNTRVTVRKTSMYSGGMTPGNDLSSTSTSVEGVYTSPVLVQ